MNRNTKDKDRHRLKKKPQRHLLAIRNIRFARRKWEVSREQVAVLKDLTEELELSVAAGHLRLIDSNWYVTHAGLLANSPAQTVSRHSSPTRERKFSDPAIRTVGFSRRPSTNLRASKASSATGTPTRPTCLPGPRRRDARRRNPRRQPRPPQGLRHRPLLGRGTRVVA